MKRDPCCTCYAKGHLVPALPRSRWLGEMPICGKCKTAAKKAAVRKAAAPPAPLEPLAVAVLMGVDASLIPYGRPADAVLH